MATEPGATGYRCLVPCAGGGLRGDPAIALKCGVTCDNIVQTPRLDMMIVSASLTSCKRHAGDVWPISNTSTQLIRSRVCAVQQPQRTLASISPPPSCTVTILYGLGGANQQAWVQLGVGGVGKVSAMVAAGSDLGQVAQVLDRARWHGIHLLGNGLK